MSGGISVLPLLGDFMNLLTLSLATASRGEKTGRKPFRKLSRGNALCELGGDDLDVGQDFVGDGSMSALISCDPGLWLPLDCGNFLSH